MNGIGASACFPKKKTKTKCYTQRSYSRDPQQHNKNVGTWQPNEEKSGSKKNNGRKKLNNFNLKLIKLTKMGKFDACCVQKMPNTKTRRAHNATKHAVTQCTSIQTRSRKTKQRNTKKNGLLETKMFIAKSTYTKSCTLSKLSWCINYIISRVLEQNERYAFFSFKTAFLMFSRVRLFVSFFFILRILILLSGRIDCCNRVLYARSLGRECTRTRPSRN